MPPKQRHQEPDTESEEGGEQDFGGLDFARFANPNYAREFKAKLPEKIRDRVKALEALDEDYKKLKVEMSKLVDAAESEYQKAIAPLAEQRRQILTGEREPTEEEITTGFAEHKEEYEGQITIEGKTEGKASKGIPSFWLEALQHHVIIQEFISERDAEALAYITDVAVETLEGETEGFAIVFRFAENPFFTNTELRKTFTMARQNDDAVLSKATGTKVEWKEGKNLGVKVVSKKVKAKGKKAPPKFVSSEEPCATFFHFFGDEDEDEEEEWMALAETLKDKIIPFAVEYYTGEAPNGESDMEDEDFDEEEEEEEEEEEPVPARGRGRGGQQQQQGGGGGRGGYSAPAPGGKRGGAAAGGRGGQQDCKQQ
jgi:nucleosome assembly protein 1-like 1